MVADELARRFLHVNLNCDSLDATEDLYARHLGLSARMQTDPSVPTDGSILGIDDETYCVTSFLYDARGGRAGCALETIEYHTPALIRDSSSDPVRAGIRSTLITVPNMQGAAATLRAAGLTVGAPIDGLIADDKSMLALDPDGAVIELTQGPADATTGSLFSGIRIAAINAAATGEFLTAIGFEEVSPPESASVCGEQLAPGSTLAAADCLVARYALPEDGEGFVLTVVQHPDTKGEPVPWGGNRQGLYRCALRVENVDEAMAALPSLVEQRGDPVWCPLPGTKIEGLYIAFLRSPDGVVFEFVERPLAHFQR